VRTPACSYAGGCRCSCRETFEVPDEKSRNPEYPEPPGMLSVGVLFGGAPKMRSAWEAAERGVWSPELGTMLVAEGVCDQPRTNKAG
jgi:hypothetical protein